MALSVRRACDAVAGCVVGEGTARPLKLYWAAVRGEHALSFMTEASDVHLAASFLTALACRMPGLAEEAVAHYHRMQAEHPRCIIFVGVEG